MVILIYFGALLGRRTLMTSDHPMAVCLWGSGTKSKGWCHLGAWQPNNSVATVVGAKNLWIQTKLQREERWQAEMRHAEAIQPCFMFFCFDISSSENTAWFYTIVSVQRADHMKMSKWVLTDGGQDEWLFTCFALQFLPQNLLECNPQSRLEIEHWLNCQAHVSPQDVFLHALIFFFFQIGWVKTCNNYTQICTATFFLKIDVICVRYLAVGHPGAVYLLLLLQRCWMPWLRRLGPGGQPGWFRACLFPSEHASWVPAASASDAWAGVPASAQANFETLVFLCRTFLIYEMGIIIVSASWNCFES